MRTNPRNAQARRGGDVLVRLNRFQEATAAYESALKIKPLQAEFLNERNHYEKRSFSRVNTEGVGSR